MLRNLLAARSPTADRIRSPGGVWRAGLAALAIAAVVRAPHAAEDTGWRIEPPDGPGPYPVVLLVSGCNGFAPPMAPRAYLDATDRLHALGLAVLRVDVLGRRGLDSCRDPALSRADAVSDLLAAAAWAREQPDLRPDQVSAMGWSFGGGVVLAALAEPAGARLDRAVAFYPNCLDLPMRRDAVPTLVLLAGADDMVPNAACEAWGDGATAGLEMVRYPDARHAFDASELPAVLDVGAGTVGSHPAAAADAWRRIAAFLTVDPTTPGGAGSGPRGHR